MAERDTLLSSFDTLREEITRRGNGRLEGVQNWMRAGRFLMGTGMTYTDVLVIEDTTPDSCIMQESVTLYKDGTLSTGIDSKYRMEALETYEDAWRHNLDGVYAGNRLHIPQPPHFVEKNGPIQPGKFMSQGY